MLDDFAFEAMFRAHYHNVCDFIIRYVRADDVAHDLTQDVFVATWRRWPDTVSSMTEAEQKLYLYKAARNRALNYLAHARLERHHAQQVSIEPAAMIPDSSMDLDADHLARAVDRAIDALPERCRLVYTLSRRDQLSYGEIAEVLDISVNTVKTQMGRALDALRVALAPFLVLAVYVGSR